MAVYATLADAQLIYGASAIAVCCDRDLDGNVDVTGFNEQLAIASRQIDSYLLGRYPLPLATPPEHFKKLCTDIAVYNASVAADVRTDEHRRRYEDAIKYMELIAANKVKLETSADLTLPNESVSSTMSIGRQNVFAAHEREFTMNSLRRIV